MASECHDMYEGEARAVSLSMMLLALACVSMFRLLLVQDKSRNRAVHTVGLGLFAYPVLQAADILLFR